MHGADLSSVDRSPCPWCAADGERVLYLGAPVWLCTREGCASAWGTLSWLALVFPGRPFVRYRGSYVFAVWFWLTTASPARIEPERSRGDRWA